MPVMIRTVLKLSLQHVMSTKFVIYAKFQGATAGTPFISGLVKLHWKWQPAYLVLQELILSNLFWSLSYWPLKFLKKNIFQVAATHVLRISGLSNHIVPFHHTKEFSDSIKSFNRYFLYKKRKYKFWTCWPLLTLTYKVTKQ